MINCNRRDGSARAVNEVAEKLADRGHEVHLFARKAEDLDLSKIRWHKVPGVGWPEVADFLSYHVKVNRTIPRRYFDIIHGIGCNTLRANVITISRLNMHYLLFYDVVDNFSHQALAPYNESALSQGNKRSGT